MLAVLVQPVLHGAVVPPRYKQRSAELPHKTMTKITKCNERERYPPILSLSRIEKTMTIIGPGVCCIKSYVWNVPKFTNRKRTNLLVNVGKFRNGTFYTTDPWSDKFASRNCQLRMWIISKSMWVAAASLCGVVPVVFALYLRNREVKSK